MRSYIEPLHKQAEDEIKVKLPVDVLECLREYCEFLSSPQSYVVTEIIRKALGRDKAFHSWRDERSTRPILESRPPKRGKGTPTAPAPAAS